ncbi:MAG: 30S ribosomal protein S4 [Nitrososphaerota archaeon]|nr:30S ribosomal protein S4 [Nitrososphaerota archaeon]
MGDPKKSRKKFTPPRNPWRSDQLSQELYLLGTYGLRNKKELWRAQTKLSNYRKQARQLLAASTEIRGREEPKLLDHLSRLGLIQSSQTSLDDVLSLTVENVLERRLQTLVWKRGLAKSPYQARQLISHGHVSLNSRKVTVPSYLVSPREEGSLKFSAGSKFASVSMEAGGTEETPSSTIPSEREIEPKVE